MTAPRRGIATVADLKARCVVDALTHCWLWKGAMSGSQIKIHTFDHRVGEKRTLSGPTALWNVAHGEAPPSWSRPRMRCLNSRCANPAHVVLFPDLKAWGRMVAHSGRWKGVNVESKLGNLELARRARGVESTPPELVRAVREAPPEETGLSVAARLGLSSSVVSRIRCGLSHRGVA